MPCSSLPWAVTYRRLLLNRPVIVLMMAGIGTVVIAAEPASSAANPATAVLAQLAEADRARTDLAKEEAAWALERARLLALIDATTADTQRLERDATTAEQTRDEARTRLAALASGSDLETVRQMLTQAGERATMAVAAIARTQLPGVVPTPAAASGEATFDAAVRALESAEQAAGSVAVEVISGQRAGQAQAVQAVKALRIAGAAAWWVALDGSAAGTVTMRDGVVQLNAVNDAVTVQAIAHALAQAEGRQPPGVAVLPVVLSGGHP